MSTGSRAFSNEKPNKPYLVYATNRLGQLGGEVGDLRNDVEAGFYRLERRTGYPKISRVTGGTSVSIAAVPVAKALTGTDFLQGQVKAALEVGTGTSKLTFTANRPGEPGNDITVTIATSSGSLAVAAVGADITITLASGGSTADAIKAALDADADCHALIQTVSGGTGAVTAAMAKTNLSGGVGEGVEVYLNGLAQVVRGAVTETAIPMVVSAVTGAANGDAAVLQIVSDGVTSDPITLGIVT